MSRANQRRKHDIKLKECLKTRKANGVSAIFKSRPWWQGVDRCPCIIHPFRLCKS